MKFILFPKKCTKRTERGVLRLLRKNGYLSTAMIQRKFGIGYADAANIIDTLTRKGYVRQDGARWVKL